MGAKRFSATVGAVVLAAAALGACGGGDEAESDAVSAGASVAPETGASGGEVSALDYVSGVCRTLIEFGTAVEAKQAEIEKDLPSIASGEDGKKLLSDFASTLVAATKSMVGGMTAAGTPDITDGERVASTALDAFRMVETAMSDLQSKVDALPTELDTFPAEASKVFEAASAAFDQVGTGLDELETPELDEVSETAPACADL